MASSLAPAYFPPPPPGMSYHGGSARQGVRRRQSPVLARAVAPSIRSWALSTMANRHPLSFERHSITAALFGTAADPRVGSLCLPFMAVRPIVILGDPVHITRPPWWRSVPDGSLPPDLRRAHHRHVPDDGRRQRGPSAANQIGGAAVFVYDCADEKGWTSRWRGVVINPVLQTSEIPETMPDPGTRRRGMPVGSR